MKVKFRVSVKELLELCHEMADFLGNNAYERKFKRFTLHNQIREKGHFTFDLNVIDGFEHDKNKWVSGCVTELEIEAHTGFCSDCATRQIKALMSESKDGK